MQPPKKRDEIYAITQHCGNLNPMLEDSNLNEAKLRNYRSFLTDTLEIYTLTYVTAQLL